MATFTMIGVWATLSLSAWTLFFVVRARDQAEDVENEQEWQKKRRRTDPLWDQYRALVEMDANIFTCFCRGTIQFKEWEAEHSQLTRKIQTVRRAIADIEGS